MNVSKKHINSINLTIKQRQEKPEKMKGRRNRHKSASVLGPTHAWIIADTFAKLKRADR